MKDNEFFTPGVCHCGADLDIQLVNIRQEGIQISFELIFVCWIKPGQCVVNRSRLDFNQRRRKPDVGIKSSVVCGDALNALGGIYHLHLKVGSLDFL